MKRLLVVCLLLALAGCGVPADAPEPTPTGTLGVEAGYSYNDTIAVDASDGLTASELDAVIGRTMARLEYIRGLEFTNGVNVSIITRTEYRQDQPGETNRTHARWNNQVWEGLFIVGEDRDVSEVFNSTLGSAVLGYYETGSGNIVIVSDSAEPTINRNTLVHELVHALQDQRFGLEGSPPTQDRQLARNGVVEGEAGLLERRYSQRCEGEWDCIDLVPTAGGGGGGVDRGLLEVVRYPYVVGPTFVESVQQERGWDAVDDLHEEYPASTEQVTHPARYPDERPVNVSVTDRSTDDWERFDHDPVADTVGQASLSVMFETNGIGGDNDRYRHRAATGWRGDSLVPYHNGDQYGYVWELAWDTTGDARQFHSAYRKLLESHGATREDTVYTVPESSSYGDAFRVTRDGRRIRIVNAPSVDALAAIGG